jgi:lipopolysaccharide transport system ATP-binding protein
MSDVAMRLEGLGKQYRIGRTRAPYKTLRESLAQSLVAPLVKVRSAFHGSGFQSASGDNTFWALENICYQIRSGEAVGIIGRNGAGKSTLLKILSRITEPTTGFADISGRVSSLLEVGSGFHPELTGRENIYLNGAILGMKRGEINRKFDEIVSFAEIEKFIDTPVKHYSSGMYLRLAFAVAAHLEPDILLVDEVLAVGDATFQRKCLGKMGEVARGGRTVLFVSHNMGAVAQLCTRALWIESGRLRSAGDPSDIVAAYMSSTSSGSNGSVSLSISQARTVVQVSSVAVLSEDDEPISVIPYNANFKLRFVYEVLRPSKNIIVFYRLRDLQGNIVWASWDVDNRQWNGRFREAGAYQSTCTVPKALLRPGRYLVSVGADDCDKSDYYENVLAFDVSEVGCSINRERAGVITPLLEWDIRPIEEGLPCTSSSPKVQVI